MSRRRRRKPRSNHEEVELNLAAMLDMAFQLLTFFILTFKPAPVEGQIELRLPPPEPITKLKHAQAAGDDITNKNPVQGLDTLTITLFSTRAGQISDIGLSGPGQTEPTRMGPEPREKLYHALAQMLAEEETPFDQLIIQVDQRLHYQQLMRIVEVCTNIKSHSGKRLSKMSFMSLKTEPTQ